MWKVSAGLGVALVVLAGSFKLYYDKTEAEKEQMALQLRQCADNQLLLENSIKFLESLGIKHIVINTHHLHKDIIKFVKKNNYKKIT